MFTMMKKIMAVTVDRPTQMGVETEGLIEMKVEIKASPLMH